MTAKTSARTTPGDKKAKGRAPKPPSGTGAAGANVLRLTGDEKDRSRLIAEASLRPTLNAASTLLDFPNFGGEALSVTHLVKALEEQSQIAGEGKLGRCEAMLISQAHTLDAIFNALARRSAANIGQYTHSAELYMRLALKAQSQCRTTVEALAEIKNPRPVAFVKQANIANGPQQVNNGGRAEPARTGKHESAPIKLLEAEHGERLDIGAARTAGVANSQMEALGAINRAKDTRG